MAGAGARALRAGLIALVGTIAAGQLSAHLAAPSSPLGWLGTMLREPLNLAIVVGIGLLFGHAFGGPQRIALGRPLHALGWGIAAGLVPVGLAWALILGTGQADSAAHGRAIAPVGLAVALGFLLLHGLAEQWLVRRLAQDSAEGWLATRTGPVLAAWGGIVVAALVWTGVQAWQGYGSAMLLVNSFLFAVLLGQIVRGTGGGVLAAGIGHGLWSWAETQAIPWQSSWMMAPNWLAGGGSDTYGAGAFALALVVLIVLAAWRLPCRPAPAGLGAMPDP